jgi:broad specificity phosphatase PhoE
MSMLLTLYIGRPGETPRSLSGQHTRLTDLPLTEGGQSNAYRLGNQLRQWAFAHVCTSPLRNYMVWRNCAVTAALGLRFFGIALMRYRRTLVQIQA